MARSRKRWLTIGTLALAAVIVSGCPVSLNSGGYLVYPLSLEFCDCVDELTVNVTNYCAADGPWTATVNAPWLTVTPDTGTGEYTQVTVAVTRPAVKEMQIGKNTANIRLSFTGGIQDVPVTAWVWPEFTFEEYFDEGSGEILLPKQPGGLFSYEYFNDVEVSPDGGYVAVGFIDQVSVVLDKVGAKSVVEFDAYMAKADITGEKVWSINWGAGGWSEAYAVVMADDGNYVVAGWQTVGIDIETKGLEPGVYAQLTKVSQDGVILWQKMYGNGTWWSWGLQKTADGGFILTGDNSAPGILADVYVPFLIKTDADGEVEWSREYDTLTYDHLVYNVEVTANGGYVVVGDSIPLIVPDKEARPSKRPAEGEKQPASGQLFLMKTDPNGNLQWIEEFGGENAQMGRDVVALPAQGGYAACGTSYEEGPTEVYLVKVDITGEEEWSETYELGLASSANAIVRDDAGNYILAGWATNGQFKQPSPQNAFLLKVDDEGVFDWVEYHSEVAADWFSGLRIAPDCGFIAAGGSQIDDFPLVDSDGYLVKTDENGEVVFGP
ncbi:MAG: BACON domain-containing protein [bacterium]|nr:BACON domain-containing protein [bacterium]